ncbi:MAG: hypothetical protein CMJ75_04570 [Planctomycetaceae bacterium]|nr:hypothetical protein [Planctomycetaceae bacterium]
MSQADDNVTENATHDESLVAYLDGELDATERARVEQRLHEDEKYRQRLGELQRSWELLDLLPSPKLSESFCNTTVEMAVVIADERMRADQSWLLRRRWLLGLAGTVACVTSALASYAGIQWLGGQQDARLLQEVVMIKHLEALTHGESVTFLKRLERAGLFTDELRIKATETDTLGELASKSLEQRRAWLHSTTTAEKLELASLQRRFHGRTESQRQQLRSFVRALLLEPRCDVLVGVMYRYSDWLSTLPAAQRFELLEEASEQRVAKLQRFIETRRVDRLRAVNVSPADVQLVREWSRGLMRARRARMFALMPETTRQHVESLPDERRQLEWLFRLYLQPRFGVARRHPELLPSRQELTQLAEDLSERTARSLRDAGDSRQQLRLIEQWFRAWVSRRGFPIERRSLNLDVLERFYDEELSPRERERLDRFRGRRFREQLADRYFNRSGGRRGRGPGPGGERGRRPQLEGRRGQRP